ncbi:MAG: LruC domain-containing protein [Sphingobacteriaceae bacterium]|nr:MAG: LruC domain-containing protein [Sphingobacteriaceae bacterium]
MKKLLTLLTAVSTMCYVSCKKDTFKQETSNESTTVPAGQSSPEGFTYKTSKEVNVDLTLRANNDEPLAGVKVSIYDPEDETQTDPIYKGITDKAGNLKANLNVAASTAQIIVDPAYVGLMRNAHVKLNGNAVAVTIGGKAGYSEAVIPEEVSKTRKTGLRVNDVTTTKFVWPAPYTSLKDAVRDDYMYPLFLGIPKYLEEELDVVSAKALQYVNNSLPEYQPVMEHHPEFLKSGVSPVLKITKKTPVSLTFVSEGASYQNTLAYYTYPTNNPPKTPNDIAKATYIFPNASVGGSGGALRTGNKVNLGTFEAGTTIAFIVLRNSWTSTDIETGVNKFYSTDAFNPETNANLKKHTVVLNDNEHVHFIVGFEDIQREEGECDHDFNDIVFFVKSQVDNAIDPGNIPPVDDNPDTDGDGVPDVKDEYPNDPERAYNDYYPSGVKYAQWGFEDNWPMKGDYDMNDLVVNYRYKFVLNAQNEVVDLALVFQPIAAGASFKNGFGLQLPVAASAVRSATGQLLTQNYINLASNGLEAGQSKAVVIPFDTHDNVLKYPDASYFVNTKPEKEKVEGKRVIVRLTFNTPLNREQFKVSEFNPFLISNLTRGREVHLAGYMPTDKADKALFGTDDDTSKPESNRYYLAESNLPWAISYNEATKYPIETVNINQAYTHFDEWAQSGGTQYTDWYKYQKAGYANLQYLYMK